MIINLWIEILLFGFLGNGNKRVWYFVNVRWEGVGGGEDFIESYGDYRIIDYENSYFYFIYKKGIMCFLSKWIKYI